MFIFSYFKIGVPSKRTLSSLISTSCAFMKDPISIKAIDKKSLFISVKFKIIIDLY